MSRLRTSFILGYHGCEKEIAEKVLAGDALVQSTKDFDWLGPGAYFWESDPDRATEWATNRPSKRAFREPYVLGAVIDLGNCLDLTTREGTLLLRDSYESFAAGQQAGKLPMPTNENLSTDPHRDRLLRKLDCAVINHLHQNIRDELSNWVDGGRTGQQPPSSFDTVRGMFPEGGQAFPGAGILGKTHTQVSVLNSDCIKGVFRLR